MRTSASSGATASDHLTATHKWCATGCYSCYTALAAPCRGVLHSTPPYCAKSRSVLRARDWPARRLDTQFTGARRVRASIRLLSNWRTVQRVRSSGREGKTRLLAPDCRVQPAAPNMLPPTLHTARRWLRALRRACGRLHSGVTAQQLLVARRTRSAYGRQRTAVRRLSQYCDDCAQRCGG